MQAQIFGADQGVVDLGLDDAANQRSVTVSSGLFFESSLKGGGAQLAVNTQGVQLLAAWDADGHPQALALAIFPRDGQAFRLDATSTAQALLMLHPAVASALRFEPEHDRALAGVIARLPAVSALATQLHAVLSDAADAIDNPSQETQAAMQAALVEVGRLLRQRPDRVEPPSSHKRFAPLPEYAGGVQAHSAPNPSAPHYRLSFENSQKRYVAIYVDHEDGQHSLGAPSPLQMGPASSVVSTTPLASTTGVVDLDATTLGDAKAEVRIYGPGFASSQGQAPDYVARTLRPTVADITTEFAVPVIGAIAGVPTSCLLSLATNIFNAVLGDSALQATVQQDIRNGAWTRAVFAVISGELRAMANVSDPLSNPIIAAMFACGVSLGQDAIVAAAKHLPGVGLLLSIGFVGIELVQSLAALTLNPSYASFTIDNKLSTQAGADPDYGAPPLDVSFFAVPELLAQITGYHWDFGDGSSSDEENPTHTYTSAGVFTATLTVTDVDGASAVATVTVNTNALRVVSVSPADQASEVAADSDVVLTLSQALDPSSVDRYSVLLRRFPDHFSDGRAIDATVTLESNDTVLRLHPSAPLNDDCSYEVNVGMVSSLLGTDGHLLRPGFRSRFHTHDGLGPRLISKSPWPGGLAEPDATVEAGFDEPLDPTSVTAVSFKLLDDQGQAVAATLQLDTRAQRVTLRPQAVLPGDKAYTVQVSTAVTDEAGHSITGSTTWSFYVDGPASSAQQLGDRMLPSLCDYGAGLVKCMYFFASGKTIWVDSPSVCGYPPDGCVWKASLDGQTMVAFNGGSTQVIDAPFHWTPYDLMPDQGRFTVHVVTEEPTPTGAVLYGVTELLGPQLPMNAIFRQVYFNPLLTEGTSQIFYIGAIDVWSDQDGETYFYQVFQANPDGSAATQLTHLGQADLTGSPNILAGDYNPNYGQLTYYRDLTRDHSHAPSTYQEGACYVGNVVADQGGNYYFQCAGKILKGNGSALSEVMAGQFPSGSLSFVDVDRGIYLFTDTDGSKRLVGAVDRPLTGVMASTHSRTIDARTWFGADSDGDGVIDYDELLAGTDPGSDDSDHDGLDDVTEQSLGSDLHNPDSDGDGVPDGVEWNNGSSVLTPDPNGDADGDGLSNLAEQIVGSDPVGADSDGDGLDDGDEIALHTDISNPDSDGDGLADGAEQAHGFDPLHAETDHDGDGFETWYELSHSSDPLDPLSRPAYLLSELPALPAFIDIEPASPSELHIVGDELASPTPLHHPFDFFGQAVPAISADTNGNIWMRASHDSAYNTDLGDADAPRVAAYNNDLDGGDGARVAFVSSPSRTLIHYLNKNYYSSVSTTFNHFEVVLYPNNAVLLRYETMERSDRDDNGSGLEDGQGMTFELGHSAYILAGRAFVFDAIAPDDADADGLSEVEEIALGTDPALRDSNGDGLADGWHVYLLGDDPLAADSDGDGLDNVEENQLGTSPIFADTDGDGVDDAAEVAAGSDPLDPASLP